MTRPLQFHPTDIRTRILGLAACLALTLGLHAAAAAAAQEEPGEAAEEAGRDFPRTLTLDEPGIDDEISLPTFLHLTTTGGNDSPADAENDVAFEIDKRLTDHLQVQLNGGYQTLAQPPLANRYGWDDFALTLKYVVLNAPESESILTLGLERELARTGAARVGAETIGSTTPTIYVGQGFGTMKLPALLRPFALTGTLAYQIPDQPGGADIRFAQTLQIGASLQYSLHYLAPMIAKIGLPDAVQRIVAITELTYAVPAANTSHQDTQRGNVAPGLIYAGDGYQLAVEGLLPLTRTSGTGVIAQLNMSFSVLGLGRFARPLW
jgi:hypothetical protein